MTNLLKYGIFNAIVGLIVGLIVSITAIGEGYFIFPVAAPIDSFLTAISFWKIFIGNKTEIKSLKIILTGFLTGSLSHYITWIFLSIVMYSMYLITGETSVSGPPANFIEMFWTSAVFSFFSLLFFGWITVPASIGSGFLVRYLDNQI